MTQPTPQPTPRPTPQDEETPHLIKRNRRRLHNEAMLKALGETSRAINKICEDDNEDETFCTLLKHHLKNVTKDKKLDIQIKILQLVNEEMNK